MNKTQQSKREMFSRIIVFFTNHPALEASLPRLQQALQAFRTHYDQIESASETQQTDIRAVTMHKNMLRRKLAYAFEHLSKAVNAYAFDHDMIELGAKYSVSRSSLLQSRDGMMVDTISLLTEGAADLAGNLGDYGYTAQDYSHLQQLLADMKASMPAVAVTADNMKAATRDVGILIRHNMELLNRIISPLMISQRFTAPSVYNDYKIARKIVKKAGRGEEEKE